jgi:hypothetical protein
MKKQFKNLLLLFAIAIVAVSCSDQIESDKIDSGSNATSKSLSGKSENSSGRVPGVMESHIVLTADGEYFSSYGGGITFGTYFPHPTSIDYSGATDGEPVVSFDLVNFSDFQTLMYSIDGNKFLVIQPTFPNAVTMTQVLEYRTKLHAYWDDKTGTVVKPTPLGNTSGAGGVLEIRGQVVRDHESPTNTSVVSDDYVYTPVPPATSNRLLGFLYKNGYKFTFYGTDSQTGQVMQVVVLNSSGVQQFVKSFSLTYALTSTGYHYAIRGTIVVGKTTTVTFVEGDDVVGS